MPDLLSCWSASSLSDGHQCVDWPHMQVNQSERTTSDRHNLHSVINYNAEYLLMLCLPRVELTDSHNGIGQSLLGLSLCWHISTAMAVSWSLEDHNKGQIARNFKARRKFGFPNPHCLQTPEST